MKPWWFLTRVRLPWESHSEISPACRQYYMIRKQSLVYKKYITPAWGFLDQEDSQCFCIILYVVHYISNGATRQKEFTKHIWYCCYWLRSSDTLFLLPSSWYRNPIYHRYSQLSFRKSLNYVKRDQGYVAKIKHYLGQEHKTNKTWGVNILWYIDIYV